MAISVTKSLTDASIPSGTSKTTWTSTIDVPSGTTLLVLASEHNGNIYISSSSFSSNALTRGVRRDFGNNSYQELWYLVNPPSGSGTLSITFANVTQNRPVGYICLNGVNTTTPIGTTKTKYGATTVTTDSMTVEVGDWGMAIFGTYRSDETITADDEGNQTDQGNIKAPDGNYAQFTLATKNALEASSTFTMTGSVGNTNAGCSVAAMIIKAAAATLATPPTLMLHNRFRTHLVR